MSGHLYCLGCAGSGLCAAGNREHTGAGPEPKRKLEAVLDTLLKNNQGNCMKVEDRIAMRDGRKQIYDTQIDAGADGSAWVLPPEDPDYVDKRRKDASLGTIAENLDRWIRKWDLAEYKKQLTELEKK